MSQEDYSFVYEPNDEQDIYEFANSLVEKHGGLAVIDSEANLIKLVHGKDNIRKELGEDLDDVTIN